MVRFKSPSWLGVNIHFGVPDHVSEVADIVLWVLATISVVSGVCLYWSIIAGTISLYVNSILMVFIIVYAMFRNYAKIMKKNSDKIRLTLSPVAYLLGTLINGFFCIAYLYKCRLV